MKKAKTDADRAIKTQSAAALLRAVVQFLEESGFSRETVLSMATAQLRGRESKAELDRYWRFVRGYEEMGMVLSTWYGNPLFLDADGKPRALANSRSAVSLRTLVRLSNVGITAAQAVKLMRLSPSIEFDANGAARPLRPVFVLPDFEIARAALVVERFLETLRKNSAAKAAGTSSLLERSCHVTRLNLKDAAPVLRDIKERGTAFMDSIDGEIEARRSRSRRSVGGELGLLTFAWTRER
jgi:hypothetical protein